MKVLDRYLLKEILPAFSLALGFIVLVILMGEIFYLAEIFIVRKVSGVTVLRLMFYLMPSVLALAIPLAFMAGVLGGLSRLSTEGETEAFKVIGVRPAFLLKPVFLSGFGLFLVGLVLTCWLTPAANYRWLQTMVNSILNQVRLEVYPGRFLESLPGRVVYFQKKEDNDRCRQVFIYNQEEQSKIRLVLSETAYLVTLPELKEVWLRLENGVSYELDYENPENLLLSEFKLSQQLIDLKELTGRYSLTKRSREKNIRELWHDWLRLKNEEKRHPERILTSLEIHKRISLPAACLAFIFLGVGLSWRHWPGGRYGAYGLSLLLIMFYYFLLVAGEQKVLRGYISPWLAMWFPNLLLFGAGLYFYSRATRLRDGGRVFLSSSQAEKVFRLRILWSFLKRNRESGVKTRARSSWPNLLDRYLFLTFLRWLVLIFLSLLFIMVLANFLLRLDEIQKNQKSVGLLLDFLWFKLPEYLLISLLISALIASAITLGFLYRRKEMLSFLVAGCSFYRAIRSLLIFGLITVPLIFIWQDRIASRAEFEAEYLWSKITDRPASVFSFLNRYWIHNRSRGHFYHYEWLDPSRSQLSRFLLLEPSSDWRSFQRIVYAQEALIQPEGLHLRAGWERYAREESSQMLSFEFTRLPLPEAQNLFLKEWKEPVTMTVAELRKYAQDLERSGLPAIQFWLEAEFRYAFSFSLFIFILLAAGAAGNFGQSHFLQPLAFSLVSAFVYWEATALFRSLGLAGVLSSWLAAWSAPLIFSLLGFYFILRART